MTDIYRRFTDYVDTVVVSKNMAWFKGVPDFQYMLEHVSPRAGADYLALIQGTRQISIEQIQEFCKLNDRIGNPNTAIYQFGKFSPTSLRYLYQAHLILKHFKEKFGQAPFHIVEVGGGYGGLCLAVSFLAAARGVQISSYTIIDLDSAGALQRLYLSEHQLAFPTEFVSASTYGRDMQVAPLAMISNYCFSEIEEVHRTQYIEHLLPKVSAGFLAWNNIDLCPIGKEVRAEMEQPMTGAKNRFVYF